MGERVLGVWLRVLLGVVGAAALVAGVAVGVTELRIALAWRYWPALVAAAACGVIAYAGALLVRGAWRGRLAVRPTVRRGAARERP